MKRIIPALLSTLFLIVVVFGLSGGIAYFFKVLATNSF